MVAARGRQTLAQRKMGVWIQWVQHYGAMYCGKTSLSLTHFDGAAPVEMQYLCAAGCERQRVLQFLTCAFKFER